MSKFNEKCNQTLQLLCFTSVCPREQIARGRFRSKVAFHLFIGMIRLSSSVFLKFKFLCIFTLHFLTFVNCCRACLSLCSPVCPGPLARMMPHQKRWLTMTVCFFGLLCSRVESCAVALLVTLLRAVFYYFFLWPWPCVVVPLQR